VGLILDQSSKLLVLRFMTLNQSIFLWEGVIHLTYVTNKGAAFSLFHDTPIGLKWISLVVSLGLIGLGIWAKSLHKFEKLGFGLILAGALGNGIDRFIYGYVIDFIELKFIRFPVFNLADIAINLGLFFLFLMLWQSRQEV